MSKRKEQLKFWVNIAAGIIVTITSVYLIRIGTRADGVISHVVRLPITEAEVKQGTINDSVNCYHIENLYHKREVDSIEGLRKDDKLDVIFGVIVNELNKLNKKVGNDPVYIPKSQQAYLLPQVK